MRIDRYLTRSVLTGVAVALLALVGIAFLLTMLSQLKNIGTGHFTTATAFTYAALTMPQTAYDMLPVATLIGGVFALGALASNQELMMMRASGASLWRLARALSWAGLILAIAAVVLGEFVAPPAKREAETVRAQKLYSQINAVGPGGVWLKAGDDVVQVLKVDMPTRLADVNIFTLGADANSITEVRHARRADYENGHWVLHDISGVRFGADRTYRVKAEKQVWTNFVAPATFRTLVVSPENLSWRGLEDYIGYLRANHMATERYETAFWHKVSVPVAVWIMVLLALPFALGRMRSTGAGQRLALGVVIGLVYYLLDQTTLEAGQAFHLLPLVSAWTPTALLGVTAAIIMHRAR
ncbi:MAG TPA: LPS export ABC transporter permease LptG [Gammaproteobacteria bacterium]|nr:LPS export ABC transporter permease LptG [Gammaproteobacteria bacterium]